MAQARSADRIRSEMDEVRNALVADVDEVVSNASVVMDWRYQFAERPWLWCAIAAVVGYMLIPGRRRETFDIKQAVLKELTKKHPVIVVEREKKPSSRGWLGEALRLLGTAAAKEAVVHGKELGTQVISQFAHARKKAPENGLWPEDGRPEEAYR
jgi:hypothetical protein